MSTTKQITSSNKSLVDAFNRLPRKPKTPSGMVANEWHFDIRYVPLEPNPSHILAIINPGSLFFHLERLPVGLAGGAGDGGIVFFPETSKAAALEVAKALVHAFVSNLGLNKMIGRNAPAPYAPWNFTTEDRELAGAVGEELKRLGVGAPDLCTIGVTKPAVLNIMNKQFASFYENLARSIGYKGIAEASLHVPDSIVFSNFKVDAPRKIEQDEEKSCLDYIVQMSNSRPPRSSDEVNSQTFAQESIAHTVSLKQNLEARPEDIIRGEADDGSPEAALDYGMRLHIGLRCARNRTLAREYLVKAILSPRASDVIKATAHSLLIRWCVDASSQSIRSRYMLMAAHHADQAALITTRVSPKGAHASPAVLMFMRNVFERFAPTMPQLWLLYKNAVRAYDGWEKQIQGGIEKMQKKRMQQPLRYSCAAVGCGIGADTGNMLMRCAGQCDPDKKPSYCSKRCQKADWKNHKPFCVPGAECSVIDDGSSVDTAPAFRSAGSIQVPIAHPDGTRTLLSSSTLSPEMLRELRDIAESNDLPAKMSDMKIDFGSVD